MIEAAALWISVTLYACASALFVAGWVFSAKTLVRGALWLSLAGLAAHAVSIAERWIRVGHGPYLGFYEVVSSYAFLTVAALALMVWRRPRLAPVGVFALPVAFLLLAGASLASKDAIAITPRLASWWLGVHVLFAKLSYACLAAAFVLGAVYLVRGRIPRATAGVLAKLPHQDVVDDLAFRFVGAGFIFLSVMIASGAIWANEAWGRYWAWDPIESWSLVSWLVYAAVLHLRLTRGWTGRRFAWACVAALPVLLFALVGVPVAYRSIHAAYLTGIGEF